MEKVLTLYHVEWCRCTKEQGGRSSNLLTKRGRQEVFTGNVNGMQIFPSKSKRILHQLQCQLGLVVNNGLWSTQLKNVPQSRCTIEFSHHMADIPVIFRLQKGPILILFLSWIKTKTYLILKKASLHCMIRDIYENQFPLIDLTKMQAINCMMQDIYENLLNFRSDQNWGLQITLQIIHLPIEK